MATSTKRAWKLQEFTAHGANVNCLALGKKSGRVLVTGGDDKKVNLWAVGKTSCIMSLTGHTTPVEHVRFGNSEELVCAGSMSGALKIWDLEAAKIVRTLTGHKANIRSLDFHPYAEFLASGSVDTNIKLWDIRRKGCIFTYKGHRHTVNSLKFSPDGRWIASAGEDGVVKLWDLPAGKMLAEFIGHAAPVNDVQFHPNEFLLASGSTDKTVKFWDLESFQLVSTTESDPSAIRCIYFHPGGECLYSGAQDSLRIYGWEPARLHDKIDFKWGKVADISTTRSHLIAASYHQMQVTLSMVDLQRMQPFNASSSPERSTTTSQSPFQSGTPMRKSFIRRNPSSNSKNDPAIPIKTSEENENTMPEVDPGDDALSLADIKNPDDYKAIFQPRGRELCRTPPLGIEIFPAIFEDEPTKPEPRRPEVSKPEPRRLDAVKQEPRRLDAMKSVPLRLDVSKPDPRRQEAPHMQHQASPPVCVDVLRQEPARPDLVRHSPVKVETSKSETYRIEHYSESVTEKLMTVSVNSPPPAPAMLRLEPVETTNPRGVPFIHSPPKNVDNQPQILSMKPAHILNMKMQDYLADKVEKCERVDFIPAQRDHSVGLDVDEFLPQSRKRLHDSFHFNSQQKPDISEAEAISSIIKGHDSMIYVLTTRQRNVEIVHTLWANKDLKTAIESAIHMNDSAVIVDILNNIVLKPSIWNLDICVTLLPSIFELLQSKYETYMTAGCGALRIILKNFGPLIRSNISAPPGIGIDLSREERYSKCMSCYNQLVSIRAFILKRQTLQGKLGHTFRELHILLQALD